MRLSLCLFLFLLLLLLLLLLYVLTTYFLQVVYSRQGMAQVSSVIPIPFCNDLISWNRNSVEGDIGYIRSKRGTEQL